MNFLMARSFVKKMRQRAKMIYLAGKQLIARTILREKEVLKDTIAENIGLEKHNLAELSNGDKSINPEEIKNNIADEEAQIHSAEEQLRKINETGGDIHGLEETVKDLGMDTKPLKEAEEDIAESKKLKEGATNLAKASNKNAIAMGLGAGIATGPAAKKLISERGDE